MPDNIRLRQINISDLTGFLQGAIEPVLSGEGLNLVNGSIFPTVSGISNIGSSSLPYNQIYGNQFYLPSGSGIYFGSNFFTAYTSGNSAVVQVGQYTITTNGQGALSIIGPTGPSGASGLIGNTGISITDYVISGNNNLAFVFSNNVTGKFINLSSGATGLQGPTGIGFTGFIQSGNYLSPLFSNNTTGTPFLIASGAQGPQGAIGSVNINFTNMTGVFSGQIPPSVSIQGLGSNNPSINLVNGMTYTFNYSGLNITGISLSGTGFTGNAIVDNGVTGYLRFSVFSPNIFSFPSSPNSNYWTGRNIMEEYNSKSYFGSSASTTYSTLLGYDLTNTVFNNITETPLKNSITANVNFGNPYSTLVYGFEKYYLNGTIIGSNNPATEYWGFYALGTINLSSFGPSGAQGTQGLQGIPGPQGDQGTQGPAGQGNSVIGVTVNGNQFLFNFSDGTQSNWITLPMGGPSGMQGSQGQTGPSGSQGLIGPQGPTGFADTYYSTFLYTDTNYNGTGNAIYWNPSGTSSWILLTGVNRIFAPGDQIQFYNNGLIGHAYSSFQSLIFADTPASRNQYFYGEVENYNSNNGLLQVLVQNSPAPLGLVNGTGINLNNYATISVNLGGLGSPGSSGASGIQGPQGTNGTTGQAYFNINSPISGIISPGTYTFSFRTTDFWNLNFTGNAITTTNFLFDPVTFNTGQTIIFRIYNSGALNNNNEPVLFTFGTGEVYSPYGVNPPMPNPGQSNLYTFVRLPNQNGHPVIFNTYSVSYLI